MSQGKTIPELMLKNARDIGGKPAIREKDQGIWKTYSWSEYADQVSKFAAGLAALGTDKSVKVGIIGDNRPRLYWAQLAAMGLGGLAVPVYQDSIASELSFVLNHADVTVIMAEDQEQVDKVLSIMSDLPNLKWLIYDDPRGMQDYEQEFIKSFEEVSALGADELAKNPSFYTDVAATVKEDDLALMCYTSGTTGQPKGVMLSHKNFLSSAQKFATDEDARADDDYLAYLPMAWVGDTVFSLVLSIMNGSCSNCPESPETVIRDFRELGPTGVIAPPKIWENMLSGVQVKNANSSPLKRKVFTYFHDLAIEVEKLKEEGKPVGGFKSLMYQLGEFLVYSPVRDQLGLRRARWCYTGGAPLGPDSFRFFRSFGINLKQVYGSTELSGLATLQRDHKANPDTVGPPCSDVEVKLDGPNGEVLVRSDGIFKGYYKNDEATAEAITEDGWFRTGDAGVMGDDGDLLIIDRAKDVGSLEDGSLYAPQFVENKLKFSPYISEVVSFGQEKPFVCAMIAFDMETVGNWAERESLPYTNYMDLSQKPEVRELIHQEIIRINKTLPDSVRIKRFLLLAKDLDSDDAEITRTRKLRRRFIAEKYAPVIDAFYSGGDTVDLETQVTYEDGRTAMLETKLTILEAV